MEIQALADLLKPQPESESDDDVDTGNGAPFGPGSIGPKKQPTGKKLGKEKANSKDIWDPDVVQEQASLEDELDSRPAPEYEYLFQQAVSAEEMFLGMGSKNTSTASCENLLVKIKLPGVKYSDVQLDVTDTFLDCRTPHHKLGLPLPHQVDSKNGKAQWDESKNVLTVTLRMIREYDFLQV